MAIWTAPKRTHDREASRIPGAKFVGFDNGGQTAMLNVWVRRYANTQSLFLAVSMHASYTGWLLALYLTTSIGQGLVWQTVFAISLWTVVALVMVLLPSAIVLPQD
jgi:hypothetical protein